jgi:hypothetical protein
MSHTNAFESHITSLLASRLRAGWGHPAPRLNYIPRDIIWDQCCTHQVNTRASKAIYALAQQVTAAHAVNNPPSPHDNAVEIDFQPWKSGGCAAAEEHHDSAGTQGSAEDEDLCDADDPLWVQGYLTALRHVAREILQPVVDVRALQGLYGAGPGRYTEAYSRTGACLHGSQRAGPGGGFGSAGPGDRGQRIYTPWGNPNIGNGFESREAGFGKAGWSGGYARDLSWASTCEDPAYIGRLLDEIVGQGDGMMHGHSHPGYDYSAFVQSVPEDVRSAIKLEDA